MTPVRVTYRDNAYDYVVLLDAVRPCELPQHHMTLLKQRIAAVLHLLVP